MLKRMILARALLIALPIGGIFIYDVYKVRKIEEASAVVFSADGKEWRLPPREIENIYPMPDGAIVRVSRPGSETLMLRTTANHGDLVSKWKAN